MTHALIALGSNLGQSRDALCAAIASLGDLPETRVLAVSRLYSTTPVSDVEQPDFFNAAALIDTEIAAVELLAHLHRIEAEHGRERLIHWGPRTLDLDLIDFEGFVSTSADLHVPHPRAGERQFVLQPIADVSPAWALNGTAVAELVAQTEDVVIAADFGWAQS